MRQFAPALLLLTGAQPVTEAPPGWSWGGNATTCTLVQALADGRVIQISSTPTNERKTLFVGLESRTATPPDVLEEANVSFDHGETSQAEIYLTQGVNRHDITAVSRDSQFLDSLARASSVRFAHRNLRADPVPLRSPGAAVAALRNCERERMVEWDIDPAAWQALRSGAIPVKPLHEFLSGKDYPTDAQRRSIQALVVAKLGVDANGRVRSCSSAVARPPGGFTKAVCAAMQKRARFKPAIDVNGKPTAAPYVVVVDFRLE